MAPVDTKYSLFKDDVVTNAFDLNMNELYDPKTNESYRFMNQNHPNDSKRNEIIVFTDANLKNPRDILKQIKPYEIKDPVIKKQFQELIVDHINCIALNWADCGKIKGFKMNIKLKPGWKPWNIPCYSNNWRHVDEMDRQCDLLEKAKFIEEIFPCDAPVKTSPTWAAKSNGEWRMCMDYRILNGYTVKDVYPIPNLNRILSELNGYAYYASLDIRLGYHHIEIELASRKWTEFGTLKKVYQWIRLPFGLVNCPAVFQRAMDHIFRDLPFIKLYLDDILIEQLYLHILYHV